jgi:hypothetical protein
LTATTSGSGKATFFAGGKKIGKCISMPVSSTTANCLWIPATSGSVQVWSVFTPSGGSAVTSSKIAISIGRRSNVR